MNKQKQNKMSDIIFERVWRGKVTEIILLGIDSLGERMYELSFSGKKCYFQFPRKRTLPVSINETIRFIGTWIGDETDETKKYFHITEVLDSTYIDKLELYFEEEKKKNILQEEGLLNYL